jgi:galactitol-specific phosphotransferase system IIB component
MAAYKIGVCCTFGAGSSMMLKMNLDTTFGKMGIRAEVEVYDISGIKGVDLDAIYTSSALAPQVEMSVEGTRTIVIPVINYFDYKGLEELTKRYLLKEGEN